MIQMNALFKNTRMLIEVFVLVNLAFLALDIFIAHSINSFHHPAEWVPFYFSHSAPVLLVAELISNWRGPKARTLMGWGVGLCSIAVGISGALYHLSSSFFEAQTIRSLVYAAPFAAPLAYTGLGFLLVLNRMVDSDKMEWGQWLIFLGLGGFAGNFVLALLDHAQNGFFSPTEWIPVISSALAIGILAATFFGKPSRSFFDIALAIMGVQIVVGMLGFYFHGMAVTSGKASSFFQNLITVAPLFAPLLFANLAILAAVGLWDVRGKIHGTH
jgi:hypothetical protein